MADKQKKEKKPKGERKARAPKDGVIQEILSQMQQDDGATAQEILAALKKKFPDRGDGMLTTIRIQVSRLPARCGFDLRKNKIEGRGLVYKAPKSAKLTVAKATA